MGKQWLTLSFWAPKSLQMVIAAVKLKDAYFFGRKVMTNLDSILKSQRHYFAGKGPSSQGYGFSSSHVWMWELDCEESWAPKNWCFWPMVLEKTLESPLDCEKTQPVHPKEDQSWVFIGRTDEAETPILWLPHVKSWLIWCWERLKAGEEGDKRGWDGWMASPTRWTWVWASSGRWWWTGKPGVLQCMGLQRVVHDWVTELNWMQGNFWNLKKGKWWISFFPTFSASFKHVYIHNDYLNVNLYLSLFLAIF